MKRVALLGLLAAAAAGAQAQAFVDNARVRSVDPQYENVQVPRNECSTQQVIEQRPGSASPNVGGILIGGVAGALLGNQVGKGHGREAATAAGAVAGAVVGDRMAGGYQAPPQQFARDVTTCRQVNDMQSRLVGYRVTYEYRGHEYTTVLPRDPGPSLPVRVSVEPVQPTQAMQPMQPEYYRR
ncbi:MAG: 17 kDa surface antigen [Ramlibacter sp.]|nr:17 kDa surface antigen [Ramlibacter sp.]